MQEAETRRGYVSEQDLMALEIGSHDEADEGVTSAAPPGFRPAFGDGLGFAVVKWENCRLV
jgi:hypothetical protein